MADNDKANILGQLRDLTDNIAESYAKGEGQEGSSGERNALLASIDQTLKEIAKNGGNMSAANARNAVGGSGNISSVFRDRHSAGVGGSFSGGSRGTFVDGIEESLKEALLGSDYKERLKNVLEKFADDVGVPLKDVPYTLGKELGKQVLDAFKGTDTGKSVFDAFDKAKGNLINKIKGGYEAGRSGTSYTGTESGKSTGFNFNKIGDFAKEFTPEKFQSIISDLGSTVKSAFPGFFSGGASAAEGAAAAAGEAGTAVAAEGAAGALAGLEGVVSALQPELLIVVGALILLDKASEALAEAFKPATEGLKQLGEKSKEAWDRENASRERYVKLASERLKADIQTMLETPFNILKDAADNVYQAWDNNVRLINATQGYNKEDLQNLLSSFSERIRGEGLSKVISSTNIIDSLAKVLEGGLSGKIAEEFAYQAAKLNAAIPTQDFYNYASTYASIAANAVKNGKSQTEAIKYANSQLESFASNLLYSSRQLAGGFSSGLQNAQDLFEKSTQIALASRTGQVSNISGVMTSVSAIVGAIAPDLAAGITDAVYQAALGGNNPNIVAFRSLAGINASNTEFLRRLAVDPQGVFTALFSKLAQMQNMSSAYMETSYGLADIFGVSADALARVDFNYLAKAISQMNVNNSSLEENLKLLVSGETTTTAEQLRIQKINEYMIDQGLAYVLDNEAARAIQQHMWDEQLAQQMQEAEYAVNLQGAALQALEGIHHTIDNILSFLNPLAWGKRLANLVATAVETNTQDNDIKQLLRLGVVGNGNARALYQLTTRGVSHNIVESIQEMLGGFSYTGAVESGRKAFQFLSNVGLGTAFDYRAKNQLLNGIYSNIMSAGSGSDVNSLYKWGTVDKASAAAAFAIRSNQPLPAVQSATQASANTASANLKRMMDTIGDFAGKLDKEGRYYSYEDWASTSRKYGIANLATALKESGYTEDQVKQYFQDATTQQGAERQLQRQAKEEQAWDTEIEQLPQVTQFLSDIFDKLDKFYEDWAYYVMEHKVYNKAVYGREDVERISLKAKKSESNTAIQELANILTKNTVDLTDPQVQGNALLAEILKVILVIMNQNNQKVSSEQLGDSLKGLALGLLS